MHVSLLYRFRKPILTIIGLLTLSFIILVSVIAMFLQQQSSNATYGQGQVPQAVLQYKGAMQKELDKYGMSDQINVLLAITTQESGGVASKDIMQASESLGLAPNTIQDPQKSIEVGVKYFVEVVKQAKSAGTDIDTAIQSYNMGSGYIDFIAKNGGKHSNELAQQFSSMMKAKLGWPVYGDPNYVDNVKRYLGNANGGSVGNVSGNAKLQNPYASNDKSKYVVTDEFGPRIDPKTYEASTHKGIDLAPYGSASLPITSAGDGTVIFSGFAGTAGNAVKIQHEGNLFTVYMHLASPSPLKAGQTIKKGDFLGYTGTTGYSTGVHLHFEVEEGDSNEVNPRNYINW